MKYTQDDITTLLPLEGIRRRLSMYAGSADNRAITHAVKEMISNSLDEAVAGYGHEIILTLDTKKNTISVQDFGRGIPIEKIEEVFTKIHSSGKIKTDGSKSYVSSAGVHGTGQKIVTALGKVVVEVIRDGKKATQKFHYLDVDPVQVVDFKSTKTGTKITWTPDNNIPGIMEDNKINIKDIRKYLVLLSYVSKSAEYVLIVDGKKEVIKPKSSKAFISDHYEDLISDIFVYEYSKDDLKINLAMAYSSVGEEYHSFVNTIPTIDGGTHLTAFKTTFTRVFNQVHGTGFSGTEMRRGLKTFISIAIDQEAQFSSQNKDKLDMPGISTALNEGYKEAFAIIFADPFFKKLVKIIERIQKRDKTDSLMNSLVQKSQQSTNAISDVSDKYKGCSNTTGIELFLAEGLSAGGGLALSKSNIDQAVYSLRGKVYNTFSKDMDKVLQNAEIKGLIQLLGKESTAKKKFDKIILAADADFDGESIIVLLLGFFATFYPSLLTEGKIYLPELPKYTATNSKGERKFLKDDKEKSALTGKWDIGYLKGLGESSPQELALFTTNKKTRKLHKIEVDEDGFEEFYQALELALGKQKEDVAARREILI